MQTKNACCVWDLRVNCTEDTEPDALHSWLRENTKKWAFQKERGEGGQIHWQIRFSLKTKERWEGVWKRLGCWDLKTHNIEWRLAPTSTTNRDNLFYVLKEESRIDGPWTDEDEAIPVQVQKMKKLYPWQEACRDIIGKPNDRHVNVIVCKKGGTGKSSFALFLRTMNLATIIPFCNDYKEFMQMVMCAPKRGCYVVDIPRAISKERLNQLWGAIETVKSGYAFDTRYHFKDAVFDSPAIFVFCNEAPDQTQLSRDRWVVWTISEALELVPLRSEADGSWMLGTSTHPQIPAQFSSAGASLNLAPKGEGVLGAALSLAGKSLNPPPLILGPPAHVAHGPGGPKIPSWSQEMEELYGWM